MKLQSKKACMALGLAAALTFAAAPGEAHQLDRYREMMGAEQYTVEYQDVTPREQQSDGELSKKKQKKDAIALAKENVPAMTYTQNGEDWCYVYNYGNGYKEYLLGKHDNRYWYRNHNGEWSAMDGERTVKGDWKNVNETMKVTGSLGPGNLFNVIMPPEKKAMGVREYEFVDSGYLPGGLAYEDYRKHEDDGFHVARFYFDHGTLVKMAGAWYSRDDAGKMTGWKQIIEVRSFVATPTLSLLNAPTDLKLED